MKKYRLYQVDSFTRRKFHGNPAGVVPDANGLTEEQMQDIARELNNSETAFIFRSGPADYDVEVRFFTPTTEVPSCGHATVAAHYVLALEQNAGPVRRLQKTKAGILPVDTERDGDDYAIVMTQGRPEVFEPLDDRITKEIADALGLPADGLRGDCPVAIASTGHSKIMVPIRSNELLHSLRPDMGSLCRLSDRTDCNGYYVFTLNPGGPVLVHGRMFAPAIGITEDPVTGNANGPLGAYLVHYGVMQDNSAPDHFDFDIMQGEAIKRDGTMRVHVEKRGRVPLLVQIRGNAVVAFKGEIEL